MHLNNLAFILEEWYQNIRRHGLMTIASLGTVTVALIVLGATLWTAFRINEIVAQQPQTFNEIDVFLLRTVERSKAVDLQDRLSRLPNVQAIHLVTREQAWKELISRDNSITPDEVPDNPLPDAYRLTAANAAGVAILAAALRDRKLYPEIDKVKDAGEEVAILLGFSKLVKFLGGIAGIGLFVATVFIVHNTIRMTVFARRREIRIMQLVGATPWFIRSPLLLEGLFHGVMGAIIAGSVVLLCGYEVSSFVAQIRSPLVGDVPSQLRPSEMMACLIVIGAVIGLSGSHLSSRRLLRQL